MKVAIMLNPGVALQHVDLVLIVVLMTGGMATRLDGEMTHGKLRRTIIAAYHHPHLHPAGSLHFHRDAADFVGASNQHITLQHSPSAKFTPHQNSLLIPNLKAWIYEMPTPKITVFTLGDYQTNCFIVTSPDSQDCWIVDCGYSPQPMLDFIEKDGLKPVALLLTHCHSDHMAGVDLALSRFGPLPIYVHEAECGFCSDPMLNLSGMIGQPVTCTEPDRILKGGEILTLNGTEWRVDHAPGHSPGGILFVNDDSNQAIVGDTLFAGSIGRFDFPTSNADALRHTISEVLMSLPDDMTIYPGHGPATTISAERSSNPYVINGF